MDLVKRMPATSALVDQILQSKIPEFAYAFKQKYARNGSGLKNFVQKANNPFVLAENDSPPWMDYQRVTETRLTILYTLCHKRKGCHKTL